MFCALVALTCSFFASAASDPQVVPGFIISRAAPADALRFPMFATFDERGRLFVCESSGKDLYVGLQKLTRDCRVSVLEDDKGDGVFERSRVFAESLTFPMGLAWRDGKLYIADPPDLITLEDTDNDGRADKREVVLTGFGHQDNGSLHGLTFGPDGWLYFTMGDPDGYRLKLPEGGELRGDTGALLRCRPDGSRAEVICSGFENLIEVVFLPSGEIIGTDNWFTLPEGGVRDALVDLAPQGLYPRRPDKRSAISLRTETLPALAMFPAVALSGIARYEGRTFPAAFHGNLFSAQHNSRKVQRHVLTRSGSTFTAESHEFVWSDDADFHSSDVLEDADGSLLVVDTGGWYVEHCPTGKINKSGAPGGLWRVRAANAKSVSDPRGLKIAWINQSAQQLAALLDDERAAVCERAREQLVSIGTDAVAVLAKRVGERADVDALRALSRMEHPSSLPPLRAALENANAEVVALAARCLAARSDSAAAPKLEKLLAHDSAHVRRSAAEALAPCGRSDSTTSLLAALARTSDRFEQHALTVALHWHASIGALEKALTHDSATVQAAALILLDHRKRLTASPVADRLASSDDFLRNVADRILRSHREWASAAAEYFRASVTNPRSTNSAVEQSLFTLARAFSGTREFESVIGELAVAGDIRVRALALQAMANVGTKQLATTWKEAISTALGQRELQRTALRTVATLRLKELRDVVARIADDPRTDAAARVEAIRIVSGRDTPVSATRLEFLLTQLRAPDTLARLSAVDALAPHRLDAPQVRQLTLTLRSDASLPIDSLLPALRRSLAAETAQDILALLEQRLKTGWRGDIATLREIVSALPENLRARGEALVAEAKQRDENERQRLVELAPLLNGGDASRGRAVFFSASAGCASCHRIGSEGSGVGPDLTKIGAIRAGRDLLESIVFPSSTFAQGYESWHVTTKDGEEHVAMLDRGTEDVLLRGASGVEVRLARDQISGMRRSDISLMPEGLDRAMTPEQLRDLLAYLQSLK